MPTLMEFDAIVDRLKWSWDHLQTFKITIAETGVTYHWVPLPKVKAEAGSYVDYVIDGEIPIPDHCKFILGDCIHSLRASLDNLIYAFCPTDYAAFPVCKTSKQWSNVKGDIKKLDKCALKIVRDLQPFQPQNGSDPEWDKWGLWRLDRLWNDDKHRAPHVTNGVTQSAYFDTLPLIVHPVHNSGPLELGAKVCRVWLFGDQHPELEPEFAFEIAFDPLGPCRGNYVYPTLVDLHDKVGEIVEMFRPFFK